MYIGRGASSALNVPIERLGANHSRAGVGYRAREAAPIPTFKECFCKVHNDGVGHVGKIRTYARLRKLPGFPWSLPTSEIYQQVKNECEGCLSCLKIWSTRGKSGRASATSALSVMCQNFSMHDLMDLSTQKSLRAKLLVFKRDFERIRNAYPSKRCI